MPTSQRQIIREDLLPDAEFSKVRRERRQALLPMKRLRRIHLGPVCTVYFETFDTMLFQIQEMLLVERGGEAQIDDELTAYNPLIPQGSELVATVMFEIDDPVRRAATLARLGGVEDRFFLGVGGDRARGQPEGDQERTREDGKTSSVHFLRFALTPQQIAQFRDPTVQVVLGCDHESYAHMAVLGPVTRAELSRDFA
ncbi:DUF3501 family protein [Phenylobacterium sp.]|jgi:hypothetical protein|uniref:DUF3501 family protein n=1 Tax=Phenylobacterium sp. TaxID=1871053 RepID=UPI002F3F4ADC